MEAGRKNLRAVAERLVHMVDSVAPESCSWLERCTHVRTFGRHWTSEWLNGWSSWMSVHGVAGLTKRIFRMRSKGNS
jgi:hypothetical protein